MDTFEVAVLTRDALDVVNPDSCGELGMIVTGGVKNKPEFTVEVDGVEYVISVREK